MIAAADSGLTAKGARYVAQFDTLVERMTKRYTRPAHELLNAEGDRAGEIYARTGNEAAALAAVQEEPWNVYVSRVWLTTVPLAGELTAAHLDTLKAAATLPQSFLTAALDWLRLNAAERVGGLTHTGRNEIGNQIRIGFSKGETQDQIAARIVKHRRSISPERASTIARGEVHAASNYGSLTAAIASTAPLLKRWVARGGARPAHAAASGQKKPLQTPFSVGGYSMDHPGDPSGGAPASLIVNCRCTMIYDVNLRPAVPRRPRIAA